MSVNDKVNVGAKERAASFAGGALITLYGLSKMSKEASLKNFVFVLVGSALAYRGASGHCLAKAALGNAALDNEEKQAKESDENKLSKEAPGHGGILVTKQVTIQKSPDELYTFWRKLGNLPQFMKHLESVEETGEKTSHWVAKAPVGQSVSWDAEITRDEPGHYIAWRSLEGSTIANSGSVRFVPAPENRGTEVKVSLEYKPPFGVVGASIAKLFGEEPQLQVDDDLERFKQLMETGEIATNGRDDEK